MESSSSRSFFLGGKISIESRSGMTKTVHYKAEAKRGYSESFMFLFLITIRRD
jgi:hypothetical protein